MSNSDFRADVWNQDNHHSNSADRNGDHLTDVDEHKIVPTTSEHYNPPSREESISLLDLIVVLVRHKFLIIGITFFVSLAALVFLVLSIVLPPDRSPLPNYYRAYAEVLITEQSGNTFQSILSSSELSSLAGFAGIPTDATSNSALALSLINSRSVLDQIVEEFDIIERYEIGTSLRTNSRGVVQSMLNADFEGETGILTITAEHIDPEFAQDVANRVVAILDARFQELGVDRTRSRAALLAQKLIEVNGEIARLEGEVETFQRQYGTFSPAILAEEQVEMRGRIRSDLILKEIAISTYQEFATINDPALQRLLIERDNLQQLLLEMDRGYSQFNSGLPSQQELPELFTRFARLTREVTVQQQIYTTLRQQYELAQLALEGDERAFQIIERAEVPDQKAGPSRSVIAVIVTIAAFFVSVFLAFVLEYLSSANESSADSEKLSEIKRGLTFGIVRHFAKRDDSQSSRHIKTKKSIER